ncbi:hypothetical protein [Massilia scottii]|uniref:hypothetical protein n=1 Tax=Massilia scottii TaxID=3057166 RepID=UPI002796B7C2|nr:hypothetical protein [Massilia sp. CCM 9029]MDQ1829342.1 hypothetical protein [Massilia sp. CCM 9029]
MNNDDMSDEQFDAFLRGEDDLSRRLQGLTQSASRAQLDAAILGYVKAGLAQEARPAAANDATGGEASPRLAPGLGRRWRIPAGIAAGVLAGVLGHQLYRGGGTPMENAMVAAEMEHERPAAAMAPEAAPVVVAEMTPAPPQPVAPAEAPSARPAAPVAIVAAPAAEQAPPVVSAPAPSLQSAPPMIAAAPPAPPPAVAEATADLPQMKAKAAPPSERVVADAERNFATSSERIAGNVAPLSRTARAAKDDAAAPRADQEAAQAKRARDWLSVIDAMLKADLKNDALAEWTKFRAAYPNHPVPDEMLARIAAIKR